LISANTLSWRRDIPREQRTEHVAADAARREGASDEASYVSGTLIGVTGGKPIL
jgi:hypothetical protein